MAYQTLFDGVHARVFFGNLASRGYEPQSEKEAQDLLELAGRLRHVDENEKAGEDGGAFANALYDLDGVLSDNGMDGHVKSAKAQEVELSIKQAAAEAATDPSIYNAVLALKAHEAAIQAGQPVS